MSQLNVVKKAESWFKCFYFAHTKKRIYCFLVEIRRIKHDRGITLIIIIISIIIITIIIMMACSKIQEFVKKIPFKKNLIFVFCFLSYLFFHIFT